MMVTKLFLGGIIGAAVGAIVGYWARCRGGTCPLTCNPYGAALVGAVLGMLIASAVRGGGGDLLPQVSSQEQFDSAVLRAPQPVVVEFSATWCHFCRELEPTLADLAVRYKGRAEFMKLDIDKLPNLAAGYDVKGVPVVILFVNGQPAHRWEGLQPADRFTGVLDEALPPKKEETPMTQQTRSVTMKGKPLALEGNEVNVGDQAPDFTAVDNDMKEVRLSDYRGKVVLLVTVPSLDTSVCSMETRKFNQAASSLGDAAILTVSMDLPFAQKRWCGAEGITAVKTLSDHRDASVGRGYGVLIGDLRLLARAVFVIDRGGKATYKQIVPEVASEPDYDAALAAAKAAGA